MLTRRFLLNVSRCNRPVSPSAYNLSILYGILTSPLLYVTLWLLFMLRFGLNGNSIEALQTGLVKERKLNAIEVACACEFQCLFERFGVPQSVCMCVFLTSIFLVCAPFNCRLADCAPAGRPRQKGARTRAAEKGGAVVAVWTC